MCAPRTQADMRTLFGCLAALLCVVSVALAARYGYKGADTEIDGLISAVVFGLIELCACLFDVAAVRLWFMRHQAGSVIIGLIAAAALIVTFTNSLGAIAGRADSTQAERIRPRPTKPMIAPNSPGSRASERGSALRQLRTML